MRKILSFIFNSFLLVALVVFLLANQQPVSLSFDPFSSSDPFFVLGPMPMNIFLVGVLFVGFLLGCYGMWVTGGITRKKASARKSEIKDLKRDAKNKELDIPANNPNTIGNTNLPIIKRPS